jgi:hypothetical protein
MSAHDALWKKYMTEIFDKLDLLYLKPASENRKLHHHEYQRRLSEIEMILDRIKLLGKVTKRRDALSTLAAPFVVDKEGNC